MKAEEGRSFKSLEDAESKSFQQKQWIQNGLKGPKRGWIPRVVSGNSGKVTEWECILRYLYLSRYLR